MSDNGVGMGVLVTVPCDDGWRIVLVASKWNPEIAGSSTLAEAQAVLWALSLLAEPEGQGMLPPLDVFDEIPNYSAQEFALLLETMPGFPRL